MSSDRTLVTLFLRGGVDGLNTIVPTFEDDYHEGRPTLALQTRKAGLAESGGAIPLNDRFALNPGLEPLLPYYRDGRLAIVHAIGSDDASRSHFEAQDQMEHGASFVRPLAGGWAARWLRAEGHNEPLAALAFGASVPESLRGAPSVTAVSSLDDIQLGTRSADASRFARALGSMYRSLPGPAGDDISLDMLLGQAGRDSLSMLDRIEDIRRDAGSGGDYPDSALANSLSQVARLVKSDLGLRVAAVDQGGYDTHFGQALMLESNLDELATALAAFQADLGGEAKRVTTVCITEFGRRSYENSSLGTDHGRGSVALVLGGGVQGGHVAGRWPGLGEEALEGPGDLAVTTDYRDLLWEVLSRRFGATNRDDVFPGLDHQAVGVIG